MSAVEETGDATTTAVGVLGGRVLPVATIDELSVVAPMVAALRAGGLDAVEITLRTPVALDAIFEAAAAGAIVGAGTVLEPRDAEEAIAAGATFIVSPTLDEAVVALCREARVEVFPGVATPTEIDRARLLGLSMLKLFPAALLGGIDLLRALRPIFPGVSFIPTGGIKADHLSAQLQLSNVAAVGGSWMVATDLLRDKRFDEIERLAGEAARVA